MKTLRSPLQSRSAILAIALFLCAFTPVVASAQSDRRRQTVAVTYPLDETITVKFQGTTRLPRLTGEAKVRRTGRRGTRVELDVKNLPRAYELGSIYTTYVLWAISPEGRTDNLGEIKRSGSFIVNSKVDVTTPLQTFALVVTAEPHFLVRGPSRMVVLENLPPRDPGSAEVATANVQYLGNTSDYFNDSRVPDLADKELAKTPTSLLGARQAINLARFAGADREADVEYKEAQAQLELAENAWRLKQQEEEVDALARRAISLAVRAEEMAEVRIAARKRREEIARRDEAVREAENNAATATKQINELRSALDKEMRARESAERDAATANQQLRDLRSELARLRDEIQAVRTEADEAKLKAARLEGERRIEQAHLAAEQRAAKQREALATIKQTLARFGTVRETERGPALLLSETIWINPKSADLSPKAQAQLEPLAALLANNPDFQIMIESHTDNRGGDATTLQNLTQERAQALAARLVSAGVDNARIQTNGLGASLPIAPNTTAQGRLKNRRTEITIVPKPITETSSTDQ